MEPPLKVLLVHNHYGSQEPSGENIVFELERRLLAERGHEVRTFERHSDEIRAQALLGLARGAAATAWNPVAARRMRQVVRDFAPGVVHAHNTFPLSPRPSSPRSRHRRRGAHAAQLPAVLRRGGPRAGREDLHEMPLWGERPPRDPPRLLSVAVA